MPTQYRNNHYVPQWYQKRFLPPSQVNQEIYYLDLKPEAFVDPRGIKHLKQAQRRLAFKRCFCEDDLYTTTFGTTKSTEIEQKFFGEIDHKGSKAVEYFTNFKHPSVEPEQFHNMILFMSTQKLRTPKGLKWLSEKTNSKDQNVLMIHMQRLQQLYCALWTECIWQIADASQSNTKFIISDHPITIYNRRCGPITEWCKGFNDPDIAFHASHTIYPLSLEKVLILTNLSWVRNPYQLETTLRPNPSKFRNAIFNFLSIQTHRILNEQEVREINFIIKSRALRYIAAGQPEWLYPEKYISKSNWAKYGQGYLCMPDPRSLSLGGEIFFGFNDGSSSAFDMYGRRPWQKDYGQENIDHKTLPRFQGEFARLFGPYRRGRSFNSAFLDNELDDDDYHKYHLSLEKKYK